MKSTGSFPIRSAHNDFVTSTYGDVNSGETKNFRAADRCIGPQAACDRGVSGMAFKYALWESDGGFCYGDAPGLHYRLDHGNCSFDDLIGRGDIFLSQAELLDALPNVGDVREYTVRPSSSYDFTYRISRLADVEKTIVIHFPPNVIISLQASGELVGSGAGRVTLTWTGATTEHRRHLSRRGEDRDDRQRRIARRPGCHRHLPLPRLQSGIDLLLGRRAGHGQLTPVRESTPRMKAPTSVLNSCGRSRLARWPARSIAS